MRIFSGIQPTGIPHLGNYLGAIKNWVKLQSPGAIHAKGAIQSDIPELYLDETGKQKEIFYSIVDLHSITVPHKSQEMQDNILDMAASLLACGVDPDKCILFQQSQVPQHAELCWLLSCLTSTNQLTRMHQWKSKKGSERDGASLGLFSYPVLMSADILLYRATHVPVGDDQQQHLELTRDIAERFNNAYNADLVLPTPIFTETTRVMNLRKPNVKMSKSEPNSNSRILINDSPDTIKSRVQKALTDSEPYISHDLSNRPGVRNLVQILAGINESSIAEVLNRYEGVEYFTRNLKSDLTEAIIEHLAPIRRDFDRYRVEKMYLKNVLESGSEKARYVAARTMFSIFEKLGLR